MPNYRDPRTRKNATSGRRAPDYKPVALEPSKGRGPGKPKPVVRTNQPARDNHWMKDLYLATPEPPRDAAAIRADLMEAEKLEHDPDVVHEEGSWGAAGCPRCDAMEPLSNELLRATLRGPERGSDAP
ncbi:hypothetical protein SEA_CHOCOLAT_99 [Arthrobacter phage Chocolat]|uniref:Uncharacterized protein n=7 Tax=Klausavirus princesstrina TaxID=1984784 RepID=A0A286N4B1_9CAUD|nr:hypothetical protein SEA_CHOCOLAT_99 [Arthrobacter phage Chocolat]APC44892.1 hypothetical protein SEA_HUMPTYDUMPTY_99 [Arthrobacter phage HumptyDumpty]ASX98883.1 hypothetical protein SEA_KABREEZE_99 [Arthrobacter phage Kabreeze]ASX99107.1 hypothetical protein SEA_SCAVITO_100 [Arthrobacter phage Scavito]ASX99218.1 hypothetical protein SEA_TOPHAT_100 [Arthrobacter phage Tophat]QBP30471.1 hypothetical protein SEA_CHIPPER1996_100 [Arthrobacter phage Chipper1996]QEQ94205.1 hypothetical protein 